MNLTKTEPVQFDNSRPATAERCTDAALGRWVPEDDRSELLIALIVFFLTCLYLWPLRDWVWFNADEGFSLVGAERLLRGQVPYRDFFAFYTLGSFYQTALLFKVFGDSLIVARTALLTYAGTFAAITYLLTRRMYGRPAALFATGLLVLGCMPVRFLVLHNWDSTLFAIMAVYCAIRLLDSSSRIWPVGLGITTALTLLTEESKGAGLLLGLAIASAALSLLGQRRFASARNLRIGSAGFVVPCLLTVAYFASKHASATMLEAWLWPLRHYSVVNKVSYGFTGMSSFDAREIYTTGPWILRILMVVFSSPMYLIALLPLLIIASTIYAIVLLRRAEASQALTVRVLGGCVFFGLFLAGIATGRSDMNRLLYLSPLFIYLVPTVFDAKSRGLSFLYKARPVFACLLLISFMSFGMITILKARAPKEKTETRRGTVRFAGNDEILEYVGKSDPLGQHLYLHPYQPFYSYMTGMVNPTRYDFLQPGMASNDQYESVIRDLEGDRTPVVMIDTDFADKASYIWPATPLQSLTGDPVSDYIAQHYRGCRHLNTNPKRAWSFYYMVRNDLQCPPNK